MQAWDVYRTEDSNRPMDTVFYDSNCDAWYVRNGLVNHDGYPATIVVVRA